MLPTLLFIVVALTTAGGLAMLVRVIDARVDASIKEHVTAALEPAADDRDFEAHVAQALGVVIPTQRQPADQLHQAER